MSRVYDHEWSQSSAGRFQRDAVWRELETIFHPGDRVLDFGCGTGEDAVWLKSRGIEVTAIDPSPEMVMRANAKGIDAKEGDISSVTGSFDGVLSNFAALNCIEDPKTLRAPFASLVRPGGRLALCVFGKLCAWEMLWYGAHFDQQRATRRLGARSRSQSLNIDVWYPSNAELAAAMAPDFLLLRTAGIGLFVPPSYVRGLPGVAVTAMGMLDRGLAKLPGLRALCDHQLLIFGRQ
jgi:SAM-dependent methyltransferase